MITFASQYELAQFIADVNEELANMGFDQVEELGPGSIEPAIEAVLKTEKWDGHDESQESKDENAQGLAK